jgi:hypothetical protein
MNMGILRFFVTFTLMASLILVSGCLNSQSTDPVTSEDSSILIGTWSGVFDSVQGEVDTILFYPNGTGKHLFSIFQKINGQWALKITDTFELENYGVTHGMLHFVEKGSALIPDIEYWQKCVLQGDTMTWYKGVLLHGGTSSVLAGVWQADPSSVDTNPQPYHYNFTSNGVLYIYRSSDVVLDSIVYTVVGSAIQMRSLKNEWIDTLQYEFDGNYLRLYNPSATISFSRVK